MSEPTHLRRSLTLWPLTLYGVGTILGAGIYVLIGEVVGAAGIFAPISFVIAGLLAALTAFSFAELSARYPVSAGEAEYVFQGFGWSSLSTFVGLLVILTGVVSSATLINGFTAYLSEFVQVTEGPVILGVAGILGVLAAWGISQSVGLAALVTVVEMAGLLLVVGAAAPSMSWEPVRLFATGAEGSGLIAAGIVSGAALAFYAFIGFEDMVNVSEEVKDVRRTMPRAIFLAVMISTSLYLAVAAVAVLSVPAAELSEQTAPLAYIFAKTAGGSPKLIAAIALFAVINGALIQIIMASRVVYGLAVRRSLPVWLGTVNARFQTPVVATALVVALVALFALWLPLVTLARLTSLIVLTIFTLVNLSLVLIKRRDGRVSDAPSFPVALPVAGAATSVVFIAVNVRDLL